MHLISAARLLRPISHGSIAFREICNFDQYMCWQSDVEMGMVTYQLVDWSCDDDKGEHSEGRKRDGEKIHVQLTCGDSRFGSVEIVV